ncbi:glucose-6-phosphate dehydrogenase [Candidatus Daviesbacteria bacterium]|nr:glucose-6-phosphate dehydrogenase [Candidatus Daviesbacteria bacterium]
MNPFTLIIFGITSNLSQIKIIPALYDMEEKGLLSGISVLGVARKKQTKKEFYEYINKVAYLPNVHHKHQIKKEVYERLCRKMSYIDGDLDDPNFYLRLKNTLAKESNIKSRVFYLAVYPGLYEMVFKHLKKNKLTQQKNGWARLIIEKPLGFDLKTAKILNRLLGKYFTADQVFRLDHYLGKETLQNILTFRFGNGIFEPLMNSEYVDHIQITATEDFGIGKRGAYYDSVGALIDVGQNHELQMLALTTMDAPVEFSSQSLSRQKVKILKSLVPSKVVFGQYDGYTKEESVNPNSTKDTFYALKTYIDNERWKDVPIYIRAGKMLKQYVTEIVVVFKNPINRLFKHLDCGEEPNILIYRIQPNEGVVLKIVAKKPGQETELEPSYMQFCYKINPEGHFFPDPYERLLLDAIKGDQTFFNDAEEVEAEWAFVDPLVSTRGKPHIYKPGSWGPKEADELIEKDGRAWLEPSMDFCRI